MKKLLFTFILLVSSIVATAQQSEVKGVVVDAETKAAVIGAVVVVDGTQSGSVTDGQGQFVLKAEPNDNLRVDIMGYVSAVVPVGGKSDLVIELQPDVLAIDEAVVVGYGTQKRSSLSTAISTTDIGSEIKSRPTDLINSLQGQIAGVTISTESGDPLSSPTITIRGQGSRSNDPVMIVVDGVPGAPYNPQDVETFTVLKDAAAASIYGANVGSGGVILITTKKAKAGKVTISAKSQFGIQSAANLPSSLTAEQYNQVMIDAYAVNGKTAPLATDASYYPYGAVTRTDWVDEIFRTGLMQNHSVSISGGSEQMQGSFSVEYRKNEGILENTHNEKLGVNSFVKFQPKKWISVSERISFEYTNGQGNISKNTHTGVLSSALFYPRSATVYEMDQQGNYVYDSMGSKVYGGTVPQWASEMGVAGGYGEIQNPVATLMRLDQYRPNNKIFSTTTLEIKPIQELTLKSDFTAKGEFSRFESFTSKVPEIGKPYMQNNRVVESGMNYGYLWETTALYEKYFDKHHLSAMAGLSVQYDQYRDNYVKVYGFASEYEPLRQMVNATDWSSTKPTESFSELSQLGMFARLSYSYDDKYFMVASVRRDASSKLFADVNSGVFPSFSGAWKVSSEEFMQNQDIIDLLKVRGSWGRIGNVSSVDNYSYVASISTAGYLAYLGDNKQNPVIGVSQATIPNLALTWETSEQWNIGVDVDLLSNRLSFTGDYYVKKTRDLIDNLAMPSVAGLRSNPKGNVGMVENSGVELSLAWADVTKGDFSYRIAGNIAFQNNEVMDIGDNDYIYNGKTIRAMQPLRSTVGQSWNSFYLIPTDGIFQTQAEIDAYTKDGNKIQGNARPGDLKFVDTNDDGKINDNDREYCGSYAPTLTYGLSGSFNYKNFDLSFQFQGVAGNKIFNGMKRMTYEPSQGWNLSPDVLSSWGYDKSSSIPLLSIDDANGNFSKTSDFYLEDGSYMRLKNLTVGYTLPQRLFGVDNNVNLRVFASGENLFTITDYSGMDPEVGNSGVDGGIYPVPRIFSFGVTLTF